LNKSNQKNRINNALSSIYHFFIINNEAPYYNNLVDCLCNLFPNIPKEEWQSRINYGGVFVNGKNAKISSKLTSPAKIEYYEPKLPFPIADNAYKKFYVEENLIFEDDYFIAVYKPAGIHVMPAKEQQHINLKVSLEEYSKSNLHFPSRLDFSTSGILICSKNKDTHRQLQSLFENRKVRKNYLAITNLTKWSEVSVRASIIQHPEHRILREAALISKKTALTTFKKLKDINNYSLIEANPLTGRTHQIRVHLSCIGSPIVGDNFYNGEAALKLHLMSNNLSFTHPITKKKLELSVPDKLKPKWLKKI
jgi:RluA family pseudouridine synthase